MELQDFIKNTLVQIARGIENAATELKGSKAIVNPRNVRTGGVQDEHIYGYLNTNKKFFKVVQKIEFDVAVTAEKTKETKGGMGISVGSIAVGTQGRSENAGSTVSRIRFSVPIVLPMEDAPHDKQDPVEKS
jgi:hypothetical protein